MVMTMSCGDTTVHPEVDRILSLFQVSKEQLHLVMHRLREEMERGLSRNTYQEASVRMLPTFIRSLPAGKVNGSFLALDLGGTNFRVLLVRFGSACEDAEHMVSESYRIPHKLMQASGQQLFDYIVDCIIKFLSNRNIKEPPPLGFTFSFPYQQTGLDQGILLNWTKGFDIPDCVGKDVVQLLREAIQRRQEFNLDVAVIINDTVGTLMSCAYEDPKCEIGLIVGTGTNVCYMEQMRNIDKLDGDDGFMCINAEWGAFGDSARRPLQDIMNEFDELADKQSQHPGQQIFEKMISGLLLGTIVQNILLKLKEKGVIFSEIKQHQLDHHGLFETKYLSVIESDTDDLLNVKSILEKFDLSSGIEDRRLVQKVCEAVTQRAARLCAAGLATVLEKMREAQQQDHMMTIGVEGSLYRLHPHFSRILEDTVKDLAPQCQVTFRHSKDGSGRGAAVVAAMNRC
ncbi:hexokinase-1-like [Chiloscyllium punctatum]|uniref:hexokinase-1-like n=1 Tax=Chiloscyllium punctatum TaxID=137246 RepID=UPI003B639BA4